jgi:hypothetical protein
MLSPFTRRRTRSDGTVTVSSFCCTTKCGIAASNKEFSVKRASRQMQRQRGVGWMDGWMEVTRRSARSPPLLLFSASFVRSFASRFGENLHQLNTTTCKTCKRQNARFHCDRHPDFNHLRAPCYHAFCNTLQLQLDDETAPSSFSHSVY